MCRGHKTFAPHEGIILEAAGPAIAAETAKAGHRRDKAVGRLCVSVEVEDRAGHCRQVKDPVAEEHQFAVCDGGPRGLPR